MPVDLITLEPSHEEAAKRDMFSQWWGDPLLMAFVQSFAAAVQMFEEIAFDVIVSTGLGNASGRDLRVWGAYVGESVGALTDTEYRAIIAGRILARASNGTIPELTAVFLACTGGLDVYAWDLYPAAMAMAVTRESSMREEYRARVRAVMADAKVGGVQLVLIESIVDASIVYDDGPGYDLGEYSELI